MDSTVPPSAQISVVIVDDDPQMRQILYASLSRSPYVVCAARLSSGEDALKRAPALQPKVILMDLTLGGMDGIQCVRRLSELLPETRIIMLTVHENPHVLFSALAAGAVGYLPKPPDITELLDAVLGGSEGGGFINSTLAYMAIEAFRQPVSVASEMSTLAPKELAVLHFLAKGAEVKKIADTLDIDLHTMRDFTEHIYRKLHFRSKAPAAPKLVEQRSPSR